MNQSPGLPLRLPWVPVHHLSRNPDKVAESRTFGYPTQPSATLGSKLEPLRGFEILDHGIADPGFTTDEIRSSRIAGRNRDRARALSRVRRGARHRSVFSKLRSGS